MNEVENHVNKSGHLSVGDGHKIYWEDWGNPEAAPIIYFHGGPGGGFSASNRLLFDPERHRVIFFDQRGSGQSTPFAETKHNTTQKLVADTEKLRRHLDLGKVYLVGGSWGSTMTLMYTLSHPDKVRGMVMWGIYLGRQSENDLITGGHARYNYPEAWERFISLVPEEHRGSGRIVTEFFASKIHSKNKAEAKKYALEWSLWESTLVSIRYDKPKLEQDILSEKSDVAISLAKLETHYFLNDCFIPDNYILENIGKIKHLPAYVVQGRFDNCTPPASAYELAQAYGSNMILQWVNGGHIRSDPEMLAALRAVVNCRFV